MFASVIASIAFGGLAVGMIYVVRPPAHRELRTRFRFAPGGVGAIAPTG